MTGRPDYRRDVLPHLTVEMVYGSLHWTSQRGRYWHAQCPFHDDSDPKSRRFSVNTETLGYRCFSCGARGDALKWLANGEDVTAETFREAERLAGTYRLPPVPPKSPGRLRAVRKLKPGKRDPKAVALWASAQLASGTPTSKYLERRLVWPLLDGWPLPDAVRWIAADTVQRILCWPVSALPLVDWSGCAAFGCSDPASGEVHAVKLEALTAGGQRCKPRWRRAVGETKGLRFVACNFPAGLVHVGEGEVTALALAVQCQARDCGMALAVGGTSGMTAEAVGDPAGREVLIHCDRDHGGRVAARRLRRELHRRGIACEVNGVLARESDGVDVADVLSDQVKEKVASHRGDTCQSSRQAAIRAWREMLSQLSTGRSRL